ncbi:MAG TPA: hypothetical protein VF173_06535 [Thermoanaerobaculia bacterium]|nr:hypothetical protein [Thermoanaerobaculia bacterium]
MRKWIPVALVLLLMGAWLATPGHAAEMAGPLTAAAPSTCSASAIFSLPSALVIPPSGKLATDDPALRCGCGDAACVGQQVGSGCPSDTPLHLNFCFNVGFCPASVGRQCDCRPAP